MNLDQYDVDLLLFFFFFFDKNSNYIDIRYFLFLIKVNYLLFFLISNDNKY